MNLAKNKFVNLGIFQTLGLQIRASGGAINTITVSCSESEFSSAVIFDMKGQKLRTVSEKSILISDLKPGEYIIKIISKSGKCQYLKFVKQ